MYNFDVGLSAWNTDSLLYIATAPGVIVKITIVIRILKSH